MQEEAGKVRVGEGAMAWAVGRVLLWISYIFLPGLFGREVKQWEVETNPSCLVLENFFPGC